MNQTFNNKIGLTIRWAITAALVALVYKETGAITAITIALIGIAVELNGFLIARLMRQVRELKEKPDVRMLE